MAAVGQQQIEERRSLLFFSSLSFPPSFSFRSSRSTWPERALRNGLWYIALPTEKALIDALRRGLFPSFSPPLPSSAPSAWSRSKAYSIPLDKTVKKPILVHGPRNEAFFLFFFSPPFLCLSLPDCWRLLGRTARVRQSNASASSANLIVAVLSLPPQFLCAARSGSTFAVAV